MENIYFFHAAHYESLLGGFARSADNFLVIFVTDQDQSAAFAGKFQCFEMNFSVTSGQVASITRSWRSLASSRTRGGTPWALKTSTAPTGTSSMDSTKIALLLLLGALFALQRCRHARRARLMITAILDVQERRPGLDHLVPARRPWRHSVVASSIFLKVQPSSSNPISSSRMMLAGLASSSSTNCRFGVLPLVKAWWLRETVAVDGPEGARGRGSAGTALAAASASAARLTSDALPADAPSIDELLAEARSGLARIRPEAAFAVLTDGAALVDIRPLEQRIAEGEVPGAIIIGRNVLEWRLDPRSEARIPALARADAQIIVMCSEGYASTLAAATLRRIGLREATDLDGGFQAWKAAGLPTRPAQPSG